MRSSHIRPIAICFLFLTAGCSAHRPKIPDIGSVDKGIYRNDYFDFTLPIPKGAEISSTAEVDAYMKESVKVIVDPKLVLAVTEAMKSALSKMLLFYVPPTPQKNDDRLVISIGAEKIPAEMAGKDSAAYIRAAIKFAIGGSSKFETTGPPYTVRIGRGDFAAQDSAMTVSDDRNLGTLLAAFRHDYTLHITINYNNDAGRIRALEILKTASF